MNLLTLDIGNSLIKAAVFQDNELVSMRSVSTVQSLLDFMREYEELYVGISSVSATVRDACLALFEKNIESVYVLDHLSPFSFKICYETPQTLGIDRLCGIEGAYYYIEKESSETLGTPIMTVDFGTATTINLVNEEGLFLGGLIAPGLITMAESLEEKTASLPLVDLPGDYRGWVGVDTRSSLASGVMFSTISMVEKAYQSFCSMVGKEPVVYVTGGNEKLIGNYLTIPFKKKEDLVMQGVKRVLLKVLA